MIKVKLSGDLTDVCEFITSCNNHNTNEVKDMVDLLNNPACIEEISTDAELTILLIMLTQKLNEKAKSSTETSVRKTSKSMETDETSSSSDSDEVTNLKEKKKKDDSNTNASERTKHTKVEDYDYDQLRNMSLHMTDELQQGMNNFMNLLFHKD